MTKSRGAARVGPGLGWGGVGGGSIQLAQLESEVPTQGRSEELRWVCASRAWGRAPHRDG